MAQRLTVLGLMVSLLMMACGCGHDGPKAKTVPAKGKVLFHNEPVTATDIFFIAEGDKGGELTGGQLQVDGSFSMTSPKGDGILPGTYKVTITNRRPEKEFLTYRTAKTTKWTVTIPEEGKTDIVLNVE